MTVVYNSVVLAIVFFFLAAIFSSRYCSIPRSDFNISILQNAFVHFKYVCVCMYIYIYYFQFQEIFLSELYIWCCTYRCIDCQVDLRIRCPKNFQLLFHSFIA